MRIACLLALSLVAGCYRSHLRPEDETTLDGTRRDGSTRGDGSTDDDGSTHGHDGGAVDRDARTRDSGVGRDDAGPVLPADPDPDLGPDARPSDYPEADDWEDLPPASSTDPCCTMDEPILITSRDTHFERLEHAPPSIAWGPGFWGLLVTRTMQAPDYVYEPHPVVWELSADGHPRGDDIELEAPPARAQSLLWAEGRWAVAVTTSTLDGASPIDWTTRLYDQDFRPASEWQVVLTIDVSPRLFDLARVTRGDRWLAIGHDLTALGITAFGEHVVDPTVERAAVVPGQTLDAVGLRSRAVVLIGGFAGMPARNVVTVLDAPPSLAVLGEVRLSRGSAIGGALASVRDVTVAVVARDGEVVADVVDPFAIAQVGGTQTVATLAPTTSSEVAVDAIGSSKLGMVGVCYGQGTRSGDRDSSSTIDFRIIGADGELRGTAIRPFDGSVRGEVVNCAVGTDDDGFLVSWFDGSALWVRRIHVRR